MDFNCHVQAFQARHVLVKDLAKAAQVPTHETHSGTGADPWDPWDPRWDRLQSQAMRMSVEHLDRRCKAFRILGPVTIP